jgi:hypothetical protein
VIGQWQPLLDTEIGSEHPNRAARFHYRDLERSTQLSDEHAQKTLFELLRLACLQYQHEYWTSYSDANHHLRLPHIERALSEFLRAHEPLGARSFALFVAADSAPPPVPLLEARDAESSQGAAILSAGSEVWYNKGSRAIATIVKVHYDDDPPYYTILVNGVERSTMRTYLTPLTSEPATTPAAAPVRGPDEDDTNESDPSYESDESDDLLSDDAQLGYYNEGTITCDYDQFAVTNKEGFIEQQIARANFQGCTKMSDIRAITRCVAMARAIAA